MVRLMRQMIAALQQSAGQNIGIQAGSIVAENVVGGTQHIERQIIYQWPAGQVLPPAHAWEKSYLEAVIAYCDPLDLADVDKSYAADMHMAPIRVKDVFTSLYLARNKEPLTRRPDQSVAEAILRPPAQGEAGLREQENEQPIVALEAIAALDRLVILGYPGGGKSTLVNYLAGQMARRRLGRIQENEAISGWPAGAALLPVRIILRHFAAALPEPDQVPPGPKGGLVWNYLEETLLPQWGCRGAFAEINHILRTEGGLILFDGLDEVRENDEDTRRSLIKEAIADFAAPLSECKVVVTCREYAYKSGDAWRLPAETFPEVDLALFAPEQIEEFARTWYQVTGPPKGWSRDLCLDVAKIFLLPPSSGRTCAN